jgi:hypothetical protein
MPPPSPILSYNGVVFGDDTKVDVESKTHDTPDGRMIEWTEYNFTIRGYVVALNPSADDAADYSTDLTMEGIQRALEQHGGALVLQNIGFGNFSVQTTRTDVRWGPHSEGIKFEHLGGCAAWMVTFRVRVDLLSCPDRIIGPAQVPGVLSYCYSLKYTIDASRYTKRTFTGSARVAGTRLAVNNFTVRDSADRLREQCVPAIPFGFKRTSDDFDLSLDKTEIKFTIVDEEEPDGAFLENCVGWKGEGHARATKGLFVWTNTLSASYEILRGRSKLEASAHFARLLRDRVQTTLNNVVAPIGKKNTPTGVIPISYEMHEPEIGGRGTARFVFNWFYATSHATAIAASALWRPVPNTDWTLWQRSLGVALGPRGHNGQRFFPEDDGLFNLCVSAANAGAIINIKGQARPQGGNLAENLLRAGNVLVNLVGGFSELVPESSWLDYRLAAIVEPVDNVAELTLLPSSPVVQTQASGSGSYAVDAVGTAGYSVPYQQPPGNAPTKLVQVRAGPSVRVTLEGYAVRAGFEVTPPSLISVSGLTPVPFNEPGNYVHSEVVTSLLTPIVVSRWRLTWLVPGLPTRPFTTPTNPIYGGPAQPGAGGSSPGFFTRGG